jgi:thioesterase domain-containing protein
VIVFEMARQLRKAGEHVALVAIFDAQCPQYARRLIELRRAYPARLYFAARRFRHWVNKGWRHRSNAFELVWKRLDRTQSRMRRALASWLLPRSDRMPPSDLSRLEQLIFDGVMAYEPRPCDAPLLVVRSRDLQRGKYLDSALGWTEFAAGGLEVVETPGEHGDMFREPAVDILAAALTRHLQKQDP